MWNRSLSDTPRQGAAANVGTYAMGIPAGILIDNTSPRVGVLFGAAARGAGYLPVYKGAVARH